MNIPILITNLEQNQYGCFHYKVPISEINALNEKKVNIEVELPTPKYDKYLYGIYTGESSVESLHKFNQAIGQLT